MKKQRNGKFKMRPVGDEFAYVQTKLDTPEAFRRRMADRVVAAVWDQAHEENAKRAAPNVEPIIRRKKA